MIVRWALQLTCVVHFIGLAAQEIPALEALPPVVKLCSQNGIRSVRVHVEFAAANSDSAIALIPRIVIPSQVWIKDIGDARGREYDIGRGYRPQLGSESLEKLEVQGGHVATLKKGQKINIYGLYRPFLITQREAKQVGAKPRLLLNPGGKYEIRATLNLWTDEQYRKWVGRGYVTRRNATVSLRFSVPPNPDWDSCVDEPPFVNRRRTK